MTALPIDPSDEVLAGHVLDTIPPTDDLDVMVRDVMHAAFQAGIEAERARAASESEAQWGMQTRPGKVLIAQSEETGRYFEALGRGPLVRRLIGPWELQS